MPNWNTLRKNKILNKISQTNQNEGFGNMFPLQGICVDEKKQICLFLFLILVSFVVLNIDDFLKKVRKFMKKLVC